MYGKGIVDVLTDRTLKELSINFQDLHPGSHKKIIVKCTRCGEEFRRERRHLHQLHGCPTHIIREDGMKLKWCNHCSTFLPYAEFNKNSARYDKMSSWCTACQNQAPSSKRHNKQQIKKRQTNFTEWLKAYVSRKVIYCRKRGIEYNLDAEYLTNLWNEQDGRCYYSKCQLKFNSRKLRGASLERLDPSRGYICSNVVWAAYAINSMKGDSSYEEFSKFLLEVQFHDHMPIRLEMRLIHKDAKVPDRKRTTDAGYDVYSIESVAVPAHGVANIHTGVQISCSDGFYYTVEGRSSLWIKGVSPYRGIIDATYTGELMICLYNVSDLAYEVEKHDRIAQIILHRAYPIDFVEVTEFSPDYDLRGTKGFGSSGK